MKAVVLEGVGGPEQLVTAEVPEPEAADGQAVVEVRAVGVNFADVLVRLGLYPQMPEPQSTPQVQSPPKAVVPRSPVRQVHVVPR